MISSMIHLNKRKTIMRSFKVRWNWYTQFHRLDSHFNWVFPTSITQVLAEVSYLVCISWSFHGCDICCLRQPWKYYENTNGEKMRTLLAGYSFLGFVFPNSYLMSSQMPIFNIGWETKQLGCFPFKFASFNNHNNKNNIFSFTKFTRLYNPTSWNDNPKFKLHAVKENCNRFLKKNKKNCTVE